MQLLQMRTFSYITMVLLTCSLTQYTVDIQISPVVPIISLIAIFPQSGFKDQEWYLVVTCAEERARA